MEKFDAEMKEAGEASDAAWSQDGSLRAMRTVLQERDAAALVELDKIDLMSQMMGGGGGMGGTAKPKKKKKKAKKKSAGGAKKDEV